MINYNRPSEESPLRLRARLLLFFGFLGLALLSLVHPGPGERMMRAKRDEIRRRHMAAGK